LNLTAQVCLTRTAQQLNRSLHTRILGSFVSKNELVGGKNGLDFHEADPLDLRVSI
jgi:hypothetical protein